MGNKKVISLDELLLFVSKEQLQVINNEYVRYDNSMYRRVTHRNLWILDENIQPEGMIYVENTQIPTRTIE